MALRDGPRADARVTRRVSPHSHLAVHHTREVKLSQQVLHLVIFLAILFHVAMVTRDIRAKHVLHQEGQTALLAFAVFLHGTKATVLTSDGEADHFQSETVSGSLTFSMRPFAPALKLPVEKTHTHLL